MKIMRASDKRCSDFIRGFRGRLMAKLGITARAEAARNRPPKLNLVRRDRAGERLHVSVGGDQIGFIEAIEHDAIEGVRAGTADTKHFDRDDILLPFGQAVVAA